MDSRRKVVYTDAGQMRRHQLLEDIERQIDAALVDRKFVPGIDVVEVTGSDVEDLARSMDIIFANRYDQRLRLRNLLVNFYLVLGTMTVLAGLFYNNVRNLLTEPTQLALMASGITMIFAAIFLRSYMSQRTRDLQRQHEQIRVMEENEWRLREPRS